MDEAVGPLRQSTPSRQSTPRPRAPWISPTPVLRSPIHYDGALRSATIFVANSTLTTSPARESPTAPNKLAETSLPEQLLGEVTIAAANAAAAETVAAAGTVAAVREAAALRKPFDKLDEPTKQSNETVSHEQPQEFGGSSVLFGMEEMLESPPPPPATITTLAWADLALGPADVVVESPSTNRRRVKAGVIGDGNAMALAEILDDCHVTGIASRRRTPFTPGKRMDGHESSSMLANLYLA